MRNRWDKNMDRNTDTGVGKIVLAILAVILLVALIWFGGTLVQRWTADWRGETDLIEDTDANSDFRRTAYESFFDRCAAVQTTETRIEALEAELEGASGTRAEEINATITANVAQRANAINQYNADASKDWTSGPFLANNLPYRLDESAEKTVCALP